MIVSYASKINFIFPFIVWLFFFKNYHRKTIFNLCLNKSYKIRCSMVFANLLFICFLLRTVEMLSEQRRDSGGKGVKPIW